MQNRSALPLSQPTTHLQTRGWISGFFGMLIFSGSLPATRVAVLELDPLFLTAIRATLAALLAGGTLLIVRQPFPQRRDWFGLGLVALGVVLGFPLLTALALQHTTSAHSLVYIGLLPLATACFGVLRGGERPKAVFWLFSLAGAALVAGFALSHGSASGWQGDALMLGAIALCGLGYAEGAVLTRRLGDWQVISWALVISLPLSAVAAAFTVPATGAAISAQAWLSAGLCFTVQHVDRFYLLVSRSGAGWDCRRGATAASAAVFWPASRRACAARGGPCLDDCGDAGRAGLCFWREAFFRLKLAKSKPPVKAVYPIASRDSVLRSW
ncbi:EamA-like transporter family [Cedecea neteri]|uniref:EamA-like transporter family n=1 Tax=Cedecea neteri TaxID=158822 RepID=A0A2X2TE47_9ENTR|nr:EamA-like transporter family [Cedecea neteri]